MKCQVQKAIYLKPWRSRGREGPKNIPVEVEVLGEPYWARVYDLMDEQGKLKLMVNITGNLAIPYYSELLRFERNHSIPPKPLKIRMCKLELYPT